MSVVSNENAVSTRPIITREGVRQKLENKGHLTLAEMKLVKAEYKDHFRDIVSAKQLVFFEKKIEKSYLEYRIRKGLSLYDSQIVLICEKYKDIIPEDKQEEFHQRYEKIQANRLPQDVFEELLGKIKQRGGVPSFSKEEQKIIEGHSYLKQLLEGKQRFGEVLGKVKRGGRDLTGDDLLFIQKNSYLERLWEEKQRVNELVTQIKCGYPRSAEDEEFIENNPYLKRLKDQHDF